MHNKLWTTDDGGRRPMTICHLSDSVDLRKSIFFVKVKKLNKTPRDNEFLEEY